jgi:hypothetical protein
MALYQNFPCEFDSMGAMSISMPPDASQSKATAALVNLTSAVNTADDRKPRIGMTPKEVSAILGEPLEIVQNEPAEGIETWRYVDRSVQLDRTHHVVAVQAW